MTASTTTGTTAGTGQQVRYGDWASDRHGWLFGLTGGAWAGIVAAGVPVLAAADAHAWGAAVAAVGVWAVVVAAVAVPVRGRPAATWARDATLRWIGAVMGWTSWRSNAATAHQDTSGGARGAGDLPGVLAGVAVHDGAPYGIDQTRPALVQDTTADTWAVVARITHPGIGLAEPGARAGMAAGLADLLEAAATDRLVTLLAVQVRAVPDDGAERAAWVSAHRRRDAPAVAVTVEDRLGAALVAAAVRHEVFVTVVASGPALSRAGKDRGGGIVGRSRALHPVMDAVTAHLTGRVGVTGVGWLDTADLAAVIRTGFAPGDRAGLLTPVTETGGAARGAGAWPVTAAGPSVAPAPPVRHYDHDAWSSVTCTVLLPDKGALMGALAPVLTPAQPGERRCLTVFYQPLDPAAADRIIGRDAISAGTSAQLRARLGFATRAHHRRDAARVDGQDVRLAYGKALVRVAAAAAVTVPNTWAVTDAGARLEASIRGAGFHPLRLDLAQDTGFAAACIPLGIGLPRRRGLR